MSKTAILGACTAYGIARKYGYTGTEEEWNALQNSLKEEAKVYATNAATSATAAATSEKNAAKSEANAKSYMDSAEQYKDLTFAGTPEGYEANMQKLLDMDIQTATGESFILADTRAGGIKLNSIKGKSVQDGEPTPDCPIEIESVGDGGSLVVKSCGKNLIPYPYTQMNITNNGISYEVNDDGTVHFKGTANNTSNLRMAFYGQNKIRFKPNKIYTIVGCEDVRDYRIICDFYVDNEDGSNVSYSLKYNGGVAGFSTRTGVYTHSQNSNNGKSVYLTEEDCKRGVYGQVSLRVYIDANVDTIVYPMIIESDTVPTLDEVKEMYEKYQSTIITIPLSEPLRSIGDVKDEIVMQDNKWGVLRRIDSYIFDGSSDEDWYNESTNVSGKYRFIFKDDNIPNYGDLGYSANWQKDCLLCSHLSPCLASVDQPYNAGQTIGLGISESQHLFQLYIEDMSTVTVDEFRTYLSNNPMHIIVRRVKPIFEPFDDQTLFYGLSSFDGVTNIITDQTIEPTIDIEYGKSMVSGCALENYNTSNKNSIKEVNVTAEDIGAVATDGDTANNTVAFTSTDSTTATKWTDVAALTTGEKHSSIFNKVSTMFKNIRFLYKMLGTTDISAIGSGTVTDAISTLNSDLANVNNKILKKNTTNTFDGIPYIDNKGVMEIGKYLDFHTTVDNSQDYDIRINASEDGVVLLTSKALGGSAILSARIREYACCDNIENADLDNYTVSGLYYFGSASTPINIPAGVSGFLRVFTNNGDIIKQLWYRHGTPNSNDFDTFVRTSTDKGATWSNWVRFATSIDLDKKANSSHTHDDRYYTENEVNTKLNRFLTTEWVSVGVGTISPGSTVTKTVSVAKDGYTPIGVISQDNDGTNASGLNVYECTTSATDNNVKVSVRNFSNSNTDSTTVAKLKILYMVN